MQRLEISPNGRLQLSNGINDLCEDAGAPEGSVTLLKFASDPTPIGTQDSVIYVMKDGILDSTKTCKRKQSQFAIITSTGQTEMINLKDVIDIVFRTQQT